jgi:hypothetical protein
MLKKTVSCIKKLYTFAAKFGFKPKTINKMKLKTFFAVAAVTVALVSCGPKAKPVSEQLVGQWTGLDSVKITVVDSTGNQVEQTFVAPIELEYLADSTFSAVIKVTDSTVITVNCAAAVTEEAVTFTGSMACSTETMNLNGDMLVTPESLTVNFNAVNVASTVTHTGKAILTRKPAEEAAK